MKAKALCAVIAPLFAAGAVAAWPHATKNSSAPAAAPITSIIAPETPALAAAPAAKPMEFVELQAAVEQGILKAQLTGNGRDKVRGVLTNTGDAPLKIQTDVGQVLQSGTNAVVVVRASMTEVQPGKTAEVHFQTIAPRSTNKVAEASYTLSYQKIPKLQPLLDYAQGHLELSAGALQTAALVLSENLPLSAVAKFAPAGGEVKSRFNTDAFRVETVDIIGALHALRQMNMPDSSIALTVDPQLKIEAMIDPLSRAAAMRYYGITSENEWEYWKTELLSGAPETRHYALYGIARFYPEIALEMLPQWVRESKTNAVYRISALQALADTQRPEALPLLRSLADELGASTELGRAARGAAEYLDQRLTQIAARQTAVAFRASKTLTQF